MVEQVQHFLHTFYVNAWAHYLALNLDDKILVGLSALIVGGLVIAFQGVIMKAFTR